MEFNKRIINIIGYMRITLEAAFKIPYVVFKKKSNIDQQFFERIMLSVTEVNGCRLCSYAHTKMALESGLTDQEIQDLLGNNHDSNDNEEIALTYVKHFADTNNNVSKIAKDRLILTYSKIDAATIDAAAAVIAFGNHIGIAYDLIKQRKHVLTSFFKLFLTLVFIPIYLFLIIIGMIHYQLIFSRNFRLSFISALLGLLLGYLYYYFFGCNGSCVIASYAIRSSIYFAIIAILISSIFWKKAV